MFDSLSPRADGRRDGFGGYPRDPGTYDAVSLAEYLAGYEAGIAARAARDAEGDD